MLTRKVVTSSAAAALALVALSVPVVSAQDEGVATTAAASTSGADSPALGSLSGSVDDGSLGGLDSTRADDTSLGDLAPETDEVCELPALGGSVAKFYPLFGVDGVPTGVFDLITSALDSFPNLLDVVTGGGRGSALIGAAGSLSEGLCTSIFGGEMVVPPVTVIVDGDGTPVTTITGAVTGSSSADSSTAASSEASADGSSRGGAGIDSEDGATEVGADDPPLATSVPVPGA
ncbi:hypothetical protein [Dietzia sp. ANT_WB102]|uniref:hypothetical protein n=1 Tax=Dietzia sp. ANT_WB102 TaxID=2597345 RepID=UPI0011ED73C2|nr:hypothetical protein [Dietzia sp. ANT_WB102]KAA0919011.1 hypothetical protein FQ137_06890 [Dietzia sp. ANT_WB102]